MKSTEEEKNKKIEQAFLKNIDHGIITGGHCDSEKAQEEFDRIQKDQPPMTYDTDS